MNPAPRLLHGDVAVGDRLPTLTVEVTPTLVVLGALASRDWRPMHHDYKFATQRNGVRDIFLNTPNQAAWFERYLTDWTGPHGRLGTMTFRMRTSVFPEQTMTFSGAVTAVYRDDAGCGWVDVDLALHTDELAPTAASPAAEPALATTCSARVALPTEEGDNPWARRGDMWRPARTIT